MKVFKIVAVKDELTQSFLEPIFTGDIKEAQRLFQFQINTIPLWKENASDYSLYYLGSFDQETGCISSNLEKIASGHSMLKKEWEVNDLFDNNKTTEE